MNSQVQFEDAYQDLLEATHLRFVTIKEKVYYRIDRYVPPEYANVAGWYPWAGIA